jgi:catechol 2,3-dioxygenase-like lactoylglutathione lyase family enzyme
MAGFSPNDSLGRRTKESSMSAAGFHHVAYACRDLQETTRFYEDLLGFPLIHTEVSRVPGTEGFIRHTFYDTGDGSCIAFFDVNDVGERDGWTTAISTGNGLPLWVNHVAFRATAEKQAEVLARMTAAGIKPLMEVDHEWCHSLYYVDPNRIMVELCRDTPGLERDCEAAHRLLSAVPGELGPEPVKTIR